MKKILLALILLAFIVPLAGCGGDNDNEIKHKWCESTASFHTPDGGEMSLVYKTESAREYNCLYHYTNVSRNMDCLVVVDINGNPTETSCND